MTKMAHVTCHNDKNVTAKSSQIEPTNVKPCQIDLASRLLSSGSRLAPSQGGFMLDVQTCDTEFPPFQPVGQDWYQQFSIAKGQIARIFTTPWGMAALRLL